jgi:hypothetical protein
MKEDYQKTIAEVYLISLFIGDIAHPLILPNGPLGSGNAFPKVVEIDSRPKS